jgi:hypothetical protein
MTLGPGGAGMSTLAARCLEVTDSVERGSAHSRSGGTAHPGDCDGLHASTHACRGRDHGSSRMSTLAALRDHSSVSAA